MPIFLKSALRGEEPVQLKGGSMYELWKGRKARASCPSYRGILLADDGAEQFRETVGTQAQRQGAGLIQGAGKARILFGQPGSAFGHAGIALDDPSGAHNPSTQFRAAVTSGRRFAS